MKGITKVLANLRDNLPQPKLPNGRLLDDYYFKESYKDNHFFSYCLWGETNNDIKCHILAGKWEVLEEIE